MDDEKTLKFYDAIREFDLTANNRNINGDIY